MNDRFLSMPGAVMLIAIGLGTLSTPVFCQEQHSEKYDSHGHEQGEIEVGLSIGYAYLKEEKEKGLNLHLHVMKRLQGEGLQKYFSIGVGAETILSNEKHYGAMLTLAVHPWQNFVLSISPGLEWAKHDEKWESQYATHLEATYIIENPGFHYGPVVGYSKTQDEQHYTIGMHLSVPL